MKKMIKTEKVYGEQNFYDFDFWFDGNSERSDMETRSYNKVDNYDKGYYVYEIYKNIILVLNDIPSDGYIVVLGTNRCVSFDLLCNYFGKERCIGYDLFNPTNHSQVIIKDCITLTDLDNIPIAFCHNDVGSFPLTPKLKLHSQDWAAKNVIEGGYFLGLNNKNSQEFNLEKRMNNLNFKNIQFKDIKDRYEISTLKEYLINCHMLSRRRSK
jgi:hypothetical protein